MHADLWITISAMLAIAFSTPTYTTEPSAKLLSVGFLAESFPAKNSSYREEMEGGEDVSTDLGPLEEANNMPDKFLILRPGGHAVYQLPVNREENQKEMYLMVQPGKKDGKYRPDFKDKANITVTARVDDNLEMIVCHVLPSDGSSQASEYCVLNITSMIIAETMEVTVETPASETRNASLWELLVSPNDDSSRAKGTFDDTGRERLRQTQQTEEFNTWLTLTSVVGKTGVGKSTVASFLAGNMSMFTSASSSDGTTTVGTDMSPIIPSDDYVTVMTEKLQEGDIDFNASLYQPAAIQPVFFMDSEGMSFRGDEFDFITSGPAAIIAKMIVWITTDRLRPPETLQAIREYLAGLDRISMGEDSGAGAAEYGQFVIVLNKMQDGEKSDEEMLGDLMGYPGEDEEMETIEMLEERFEDISVVGLPIVHVEEGEEFGFSVLPVRFREGLAKIANKVLHGIESPRVVNVGNQKYEMNSTEAVTIVSMLIDAANQGNIDLTDPCNVLYTIKKEKVLEAINQATEEMDTKISCEITDFGVNCRKCICPFRNILITNTAERLRDVIANAVDDAQDLCSKDPSIAERIAHLEDLVTTWDQAGRCVGTFIGNDDPNICDISEMMFTDSETRVCTSLFLCGEPTFSSLDVSIEVKESIFIDTVTPQVIITPPPKANNGSAGKDGYPGENGNNFNLNLTGCTLLTGSGSLLLTNLTGGDGGDGGDGPILEATPDVPCGFVNSSGHYDCCSYRTCTDTSGDKHCPYVPYITDCEGFWGGDCYGGHEDDKTYLLKDRESNCTIDDLSSLNGGNGGKGGNPGKCQISGLDINCVEEAGIRNGGNGGQAGYQKKQKFDVTAVLHFATGYYLCRSVDNWADKCDSYEERYRTCEQSKVKYDLTGTVGKSCEGQGGISGN